MTTDSLKESLKKIWYNRDLKEIACQAAKIRINTPGEWALPTDVTPLKELMYLSVGIPDSAFLPRKQLNEAMQKVMDHKDDACLRYGFGQGYYPIRKYLADKYSGDRKFEVTEDWFLLSNGSSSAIDLVVRSIIDPGDVIIAESPSYMGSLGNFIGVGAEIHAVAMDESGMNINELKQKIDTLEKQGKSVKLVYTISSFHNPTGVVMSSERKKELLQLAAEKGFLILDDDAYGELYYDHPPSETLSGLSNGYGVITVGTFSKIVATGLRIGWVHARPDFIAMLGRMRFDMGQNQMALRMMGHFLNSGYLETHSTEMRNLYKTKMTVIADAMEHFLGEYVSFKRPLGGFYLWVKLAEGLSTKEVWRTATQEGVTVNPGYSFFPGKSDSKEDFLRIAFSWAPTGQLEEAAKRLAKACQRVAGGDAA